MRECREELQALDPEEPARSFHHKSAIDVLELPVWKQARVVVVFEPFKYEPELHALISDFAAARRL